MVIKSSTVQFKTGYTILLNFQQFTKKIVCEFQEGINYDTIEIGVISWKFKIVFITASLVPFINI